MSSYLNNSSAVTLDTFRLGHGTDQERIEGILRISEGLWVCGSAFLECYMPTYSQRIGEMIKAGDPIERGRCEDPLHNHRSKMGAYRWQPTEENGQTHLTV